MKSEADRILRQITDFYIGSHDFNGISGIQLLRVLKLPWPELLDSLIELIKDEKITLTFSSVVVNPHIISD